MNKLVLVLLLSLAQQHFAQGFRIQKEIKNEISELKNALEKLGAPTLTGLESTINNLIETSLQVKQNCTSLLEKTAKNSQATIKGLVEAAVKSGKDVSSCTKDVDVSLVKKVTEEMTKCIETEISEGQKFVQTAIGSIKDFFKVTDAFEEQIKDCGTGLRSVVCVGKIGAKLVTDGGLITSRIAALADTAISYGYQVKEKFSGCEGRALEEAGRDFGQLISDVGDCIEKLV